MLLFFQVGTSLSSRECLTSVKTMTSLRWKPDSFYNFFFIKKLILWHRWFLVMKWLTQWSGTLRSNSLAPLSFRCQQTLGWELAEDTNPWPMFNFTINKYWVKSTPSWFCLCHLLFYGLLSQTMVWLSLLTGSFKRFVHCFQSAVKGWLCQQLS